MEKGGKSAKQDRKARLSEALRANLQRRKAGRRAARLDDTHQDGQAVPKPAPDAAGD